MVRFIWIKKQLLMMTALIQLQCPQHHQKVVLAYRSKSYQHLHWIWAHILNFRPNIIFYSPSVSQIGIWIIDATKWDYFISEESYTIEWAYRTVGPVSATWAHSVPSHSQVSFIAEVVSKPPKRIILELSPSTDNSSTDSLMISDWVDFYYTKKIF